MHWVVVVTELRRAFGKEHVLAGRESSECYIFGSRHGTSSVQMFYGGRCPATIDCIRLIMDGVAYIF